MNISKCPSTCTSWLPKEDSGVSIIKRSYSLNQNMINARWKKMFDLKVEIKGYHKSTLGAQDGMGCPGPKGQRMHSVPASSPVLFWDDIDILAILQIPFLGHPGMGLISMVFQGSTYEGILGWFLPPSAKLPGHPRSIQGQSMTGLLVTKCSFSLNHLLLLKQ